MFEIGSNELDVVLDDFNDWFEHELATKGIVFKLDAINKLNELIEEKEQRHVKKND